MAIVSKVKVSSRFRITIPKKIVYEENMNNLQYVNIVLNDSETLFIKRKLDSKGSKNYLTKRIKFSKCWNDTYRITIPGIFLPEMLNVKRGGYMYVYVNENKDIVATTNFLKKGVK